jgi:hypothetical protein
MKTIYHYDGRPLDKFIEANPEACIIIRRLDGNQAGKYSRTKYNRMNHAEQAVYEKRLSEKKNYAYLYASKNLTSCFNMSVAEAKAIVKTGKIPVYFTDGFFPDNKDLTEKDFFLK